MERRLTGMIAAAAVLIVLFIFWDVFRPTPRSPAEPVADGPLRIAEPQPPPPAPPQPPSTTSQGTAIPAGPDGREPSYIELLARSETRRRIRSSGSTTYLGEMIEATGDSMLRRWENRMTEPIRVWFAPTHAANFKPAFMDAFKSGFGVWSVAGVPFRFQLECESTYADDSGKVRSQIVYELT